MSGNVFKDVHLQKNPDNNLILIIFHFEISGIDFKDEHSQNINEQIITFDIYILKYLVILIMMSI